MNDVYETPYYIIASDPGNYTVAAVDDAHCTGTASGAAIVRKYPVPGTPEITVYGTELISSACCGNQWYKNGVAIPGETDQTYQVLENGEYFTIVTINSCSSAPSDTMNIIVGIKEIRQENLTCIPNPAKDIIDIWISDDHQGALKLSLFSPTGALIKEYHPSFKANKMSLDISTLPTGLYFIKLQGTHMAYIGKFLKL